MVALFKLLILVIIVIIFRILIASARFVFGIGETIAQDKRTSISQTYEGNFRKRKKGTTNQVPYKLFEMYVEIIREYEVVSISEYGSIKEFVLARELYFVFCSYVLYILKIDVSDMSKPLIDYLLSGVSLYREHNNIVFSYAESVTRTFEIRNKEYLEIITSIPEIQSEPVHTPDPFEMQEMFEYSKRLFSKIEEFINLNIDYEFAVEPALKQMLIVELQGTAVELSKEIIRSSLAGEHFI